MMLGHVDHYEAAPDADDLKQLLLDNGLTRVAVADKVGVKGPYVSRFINGGYLPRYAWQKLYEFFLELRINHEPTILRR